MSFEKPWRRRLSATTSMPGGDVSAQAQLHESGNWIVVPVAVRGAVDLLMVLDTGSPVSVLSPLALADLLARGLLGPEVASNRYLLAGLSVQGQSLPDMLVRVLPRLARIQVDGLLGLDFLRSFRAVHFHVDTFRLILEDP